jgi:antitoxin YefM
MQAVFHVYPEELDSQFLTLLKELSKNKKLTITVPEDLDDDGHDETAYLMSSPANRDRLMRAIASVNSRKNLITVTPEELLAGVSDEEDHL